MKLILTVACIAALLPSITAQNNSIKKTMSWGESDVVDRRMTTFPADPTADAVVLDASTRLRVEMKDNHPQLTVQVHRRIKLLTEGSLQSQSIVNLPINLPADRVTMTAFKAQLLDLDNGQEAIPIEESKDNNVEHLTISGLKQGFILEYRYNFTTDSLPVFTNWAFQEALPIRRAELWASVSSAFDYSFSIQNKDKITSLVDAGSNAKVFVGTDMPAMRVKTNSLMTSDYLTAVRLQVNYATVSGNSRPFYALNWRELAQNLQKNDKLGAQFLRKENFETLWQSMESVVSVARNKDEKVKAIYDFINKNVEWNGEWAIFASENLDNAFQKRSANSGEMNLMLIACLNAAGIRALPLLVSTRIHGKVNVNTAVVSQFDHLICYTESNGAPLLLDAGDIYRPMNTLRIESLNADAWLMDANAPLWIKITPSVSIRQTLSSFTLSNEGDLRGRFVKTSKGYEAVTERNDQSRKQTTKILQREYQGIRIDSVTTYNLEANLSSSFKRNFYCAIPRAIEAENNKMTIKPMWQTGLENNLLPPQRPCPIDFAYPINDLHVFNIAIPEGASVDKMPKDETFEFADKGASYQFTASILRRQNSTASKNFLTALPQNKRK
jgi:hypothetical protein